MRTLAALFAAMALATAVVRGPAFAKAPAGKQAGPPLPPGNEAAGASIVAGTGMCLTCHRVHGKGSRLGPDLTDIAASRRAEQLHASLIDPDAEILPENRRYRVVTRDGVAITGRLLNHDIFQVLMMDPKEQLRSFDKAELREHGFVKESAMPSYREKLSSQELADVIAYLVTLKGVTPQ
jgi:putative heme-binding domain-containing protein